MKNISIKQTGYGHWEVSTTFRNKTIKCITTNSVAIDNYKSDLMPKQRGTFGRTARQASIELYNEIVNANKK